MANYRKALEIKNRLKSRPCADCGRSYNPWVMDFDHRNPSEKLGNIAHLYHEKRILEEVAKCDVVCSNCHRERTHQRFLAFKGNVVNSSPAYADKEKQNA